MELVVLGSAGYVPQDRRATTSIAMRDGETLLICDAGTGLARLREPGLRRLVPAEGEIHIFLSHLHLDHTVGLSFIPALWRTNPTTIHFMAEEVSGFGSDVLDRLIGPPFFPYTLAAYPMPVAIHPVVPGTFNAGGIEIRAQKQDHPGASLAYRVGDWLCFETDTVFDAASAEFARGCRILIHEAWIRGSQDPPELQATLKAHTSAEDAARIAAKAGVGELLLSHLAGRPDEGYLGEMLEAARAIFPRTNLCEDRLSRILD